MDFSALGGVLMFWAVVIAIIAVAIGFLLGLVF